MIYEETIEFLRGALWVLIYLSCKSFAEDQSVHKATSYRRKFTEHHKQIGIEDSKFISRLIKSLNYQIDLYGS